MKKQLKFKNLKYLVALSLVLLTFGCMEKKDKDPFPKGSVWSSREFTDPSDRILNGNTRNLIEFIDDKSFLMKFNNGCFLKSDGEASLENLDDPNKFFEVYKFNYKYADNYLEIFSGNLISDTNFRGSSNRQNLLTCKKLESNKYVPKEITDILDSNRERGFKFEKTQKTLNLVLKSKGQMIYSRIK